jgi:nitrogen fixation protein NifT
MPSVMIRREDDGRLSLYVPKKDLEEFIESMEFQSEDKWGGEIELGDGSKYYIEPMAGEPNLPITLRAKRA